MQVAYELLGKGKELSEKKGGLLTAVLFGEDIRAEISKLFAYEKDSVIYCENTALRTNLEEDQTRLLEQLIADHKPEIFLYCHRFWTIPVSKNSRKSRYGTDSRLHPAGY